MKDFRLLAKLKQEVRSGNVYERQYGKLFLYKYTEQCAYKNLWTPINRQARGIIFTEDGTIIARPFKKFFNIGELEESLLNNLPISQGYEIFEKLDGSMGSAFYYNNKWQLATPGSIESDQAIDGTNILYDLYEDSFPYLEKLINKSTPIFEIIYPNNRIVCDYSKDQRGDTFLSLLAIIDLDGNEWNQNRVDEFAWSAGFPRPKRYTFSLSESVPFVDNEEGYVCLFDSGLRVKIKSPAYIQVHKLLTYLTPKGVIDLMRGKEYGITIKQLPRDLQIKFDDIRAEMQQKYDSLNSTAEQYLQNLYFQVGAEGTRKDQALWIQQKVPKELCPVMFARLDNKPVEHILWKVILHAL